MWEDQLDRLDAHLKSVAAQPPTPALETTTKKTIRKNSKKVKGKRDGLKK